MCKDYKYDSFYFGVIWLIISVILEIWWLIAVIVSAVRGPECGWEAVEGQDWFVLIILILIFFGQFSIGELIGLIEYQRSQKMNIGMFPKWVLISLQVVSGIYLILNILAIANSLNENAERAECWTGQIMVVTVVVNCAYCLICFVFSFITLPLADINSPENQNVARKIPQKDEDLEEEEEEAKNTETEHLVDAQKERESGDGVTEIEVVEEAKKSEEVEKDEEPEQVEQAKDAQEEQPKET